VCVRTCDGGFFPVSYSARRDNLDELNDMCHALCPNAETTVYTYSVSRDIESAISIDGSPYADLPNASRFEKTYDPSCTCRAPGKTWVETLAEAERMLHTAKTDIIVTQEKADELSRPRPAVATKPKPGAKAADLQLPAPAKPADSAPADDPTAAEGAVAAQVQAEGKESAGISVGNAVGGSAFGTGQGETREIVGPDGVKRRVRIIAPTL
jgi:hypothetical protein